MHKIDVNSIQYSVFESIIIEREKKKIAHGPTTSGDGSLSVEAAT